LERERTWGREKRIGARKAQKGRKPRKKGVRQIFA
jgi:hypothetical protein